MKLPFRRGAREGRPLPNRGPRFPVWKDEKLFGFITLRILALVIGLLSVVFIVLLVWGAFTIIDLTDKVQRQADRNTELLQTQEDLRRTGHADRIADQKRTDAEIRNLACSIIALVPKGNAFGNVLRDNFADGGIHCPPLGEPFIPEPITPQGSEPPATGTTSSPTPAPSPARNSPTPSPTPSRASHSPAAGGPGVPSGGNATVTTTAAGPTQTKTVTSSPAPHKTIPLVPCVSIGVVRVNCE